MSGSTSDVNRDRTVKVADSTPASGSRSADPPVADSQSEVAKSTARPSDSPSGVTTAAEARATAPDVKVVQTGAGLQTPEEAALGAEPRTGPLPGDDPEANPSHPSSLRIRRSDGEPVLKTVRGGAGDDLDRLPGWEAAEDPRAVPSHPSKIEPDPTGVSAYRLVDAHAEQPESDADYPADVSDERRALAQSDEKGHQTVVYNGTEAVTLNVPDNGGGYDGLHTTGTTVNFRPGQAQSVPAKVAAWLTKHPRLDFKKA